MPLCCRRHCRWRRHGHDARWCRHAIALLSMLLTPRDDRQRCWLFSPARWLRHAAMPPIMMIISPPRRYCHFYYASATAARWCYAFTLPPRHDAMPLFWCQPRCRRCHTRCHFILRFHDAIIRCLRAMLMRH